MRSRAASSRASLRRCPSGILRASAITSVARASQSWLCADWEDIGLGGEPIILLSSNKRARYTLGHCDCLTSPMVLHQHVIRRSILLCLAIIAGLAADFENSGNHTRSGLLPLSVPAKSLFRNAVR